MDQSFLSVDGPGPGDAAGATSSGHHQSPNGHNAASAMTHGRLYNQELNNLLKNEPELSTRLEAPIPPLHVQQKFLNDHSPNTNNQTPVNSHLGYPHNNSGVLHSHDHNTNESSGSNGIASNGPGSEASPANGDIQYITSCCSRCKKDFNQPLIIPKSSGTHSNGSNSPSNGVKNEDDEDSKPLVEPKIYKLCQHCRELQRQRSRRWQKKTKEKVGVCRRCGNDIPPELQKFVLCLSCRQNLRFRKANRAKQGRCVHCSGPLDSSILNAPPDHLDPEQASLWKSTNKSKSFKVCKRCRENDKIRRNNLEKLGNCNRCAKPLPNEELGKNKVCKNCRTKKKKSISMDNDHDQFSVDSHNQVNQAGSGQYSQFSNPMAPNSSIQQQLNQALQPQAPIPQQMAQMNQMASIGQMAQMNQMGQMVGQMGPMGQMSQVPTNFQYDLQYRQPQQQSHGQSQAQPQYYQASYVPGQPQPGIPQLQQMPYQTQQPPAQQPTGQPPSQQQSPPNIHPMMQQPNMADKSGNVPVQMPMNAMNQLQSNMFPQYSTGTQMPPQQGTQPNSNLHY